MVLHPGRAPSSIFGANMAFKRTVFTQVGFFRTDLGVQGDKPFLAEESELVRRLVMAGKRIVYTPDAIVHHKVPAEHMRLSYFRRKRFYQGRSQRLMNDDHPGSWHIPPTWLVRECISHGMGALKAKMVRQHEQSIQRELQFWTQLGQIVGAFRA